MMVSNEGSVKGLLRWQSTNVRHYALSAFVVCLLHFGLDYGLDSGMFADGIPKGVPTFPLSVVGGALGIFVSFRTNSAYDRWWEGRKLWGRLINTSRMWCTQVVSYVQDESIRKELVGRHIAYVHALRCLLRKQDPFADAQFMSWLTEDEKRELPGSTNLTHALLQLQQDRVTGLGEAGGVDSFRLQVMDRSVMHLLDIQGGCERIKKTPLPRGYGFIAETLIRYYAMLLPFALVAHFGWLAIPLNVLICLSFMLISEAGRVLEDPFTMFFNGLPLQAMSDTIERNLRQRIGMEEGMPAAPQPDPRGILM